MDYINDMKKLYPDLLKQMQERYLILYNIHLLQPIGRRFLIRLTNLTERKIRNEIQYLHEQGLIQLTTKGMYITNEGKIIIEKLNDFNREISGLRLLEKQLKDKLEIERIVVVPGNSDRIDHVKMEMGKACVQFLLSYIQTDTTFVVTGGTTMAAVANEMLPLGKSKCMFVPARGGIGEKVENQANTIVAKMAEKENGDYRLLFAPDPLSESSYQSLIQEPSIQETLKMIKNAQVVLHGVGDALVMAKKRKTPDNIMKRLKKERAVSEAFGYYFNEKGEIVHKLRTIGLQLDDVKQADFVITIAGGASKGLAIASYMKKNKSDLLITDEAAATSILKINI